MPRRFLPVLLFIFVLIAADKKDQTPDPPLSRDEKTILELTNKARVDNKLPPLTLNAVLTKVARAHSANMAKKGEMNHVLDGKRPADRIKEAGYDYSWCGENIAMGENVSVQQIFDEWMKSQGHRENILKKQYQEIGIGIARADDGKVYYSQEFGAPLDR
jgi:uncharacterized protein YkwD